MINNKLYTIGYGNRSLKEFISLLQKYNIQILVDIRSIPYSRYQPQFNKNSLNQYLLSLANVQYIFKGEELGVKSKDISVGYINYESKRKTLPYLRGIEFLEQGLESGVRIAIMCCELDYRNCHRFSLVGEDIFKRGWGVVHIDKTGEPIEHKGLL